MKLTSQGLVVGVTGVVMITMVIANLHTRYVKPNFSWALLIAGAVLVVLSAATFLAARHVPTDGAAAEHDHGPASEHDHTHANEHEHGDAPGSDHGHDHSKGPAMGWFMLTPAVIMALIMPPALGSDAASRATDTARQPMTQPSRTMPDLPPGDPVSVPLDIFIMHANYGKGETATGRRVQLLGFASPTKDGHGWYLTRMSIQCCAGDAFPFRVRILDQPAPKNDQWVEVVGTLDPALSQADKSGTPYLHAETVTNATAPARPYL